jgi:hypothetical protein
MQNWGKRLRARALLRAGTLDTDGLTQIRNDLRGVDEERARTVTAEILLALGKPDEALAHAAQAAREAGDRDWTPEVVAALEVQSLVLLEMNRPADALIFTADALQQAKAMGAQPMVWRLQALKARAHLRLNDQEAARQARAAAADIVRALAASIPDATRKQAFLASVEVSSILAGTA